MHGLENRGVVIEPAKNKQGKTYGIRFNYEGHTFKASEIGREFGFHTIAKNFSPSPEQSQSNNQQLLFSMNSRVGSLLADLLTPIGKNHEEENELTHRKRRTKKRYYGRQL